MRKQILKNLATNYLGNFLGMAFGVLIIPFLIFKVGKVSYGLIVLAEAIIGFFQIFVFSVRIALSRYATLALAQNKIHDFEQYLSTGKVILYVSSAGVLIIGMLTSQYFPLIFKVPSELGNQSRILFYFITVAFALTIPNVVYWSILYARQRFDLINISNFGGIILRFIAIFIIFSLVPARWVNLATYGVIYLLMTWGQNILVYLWAKHVMPQAVISRQKFDRTKVKEIISFSGYFSLGSLSTMLYENAMNIIINLFLGPAANAVYAVGTKFPSMMKRLFLDPSLALNPTFTELAGKNDKVRIEKLFFMYSKMINIAVIPVGLILIFFAPQIITRWVGRDFFASAEIMPFFMLAVMCAIPSSLCSCVNNAYGIIKVPTLVNLALSVANVILGIVFGLVLKGGLWGIALAAFLMNIVGSLIFLPTYTCLKAGLSLSRFWLETILKPVALSVFFIGGIALLMGADRGGQLTLSLGMIIIFSFVIMADYLVAFFVLTDKAEKDMLVQILTEMLWKKNLLKPGASLKTFQVCQKIPN